MLIHQNFYYVYPSALLLLHNFPHSHNHRWEQSSADDALQACVLFPSLLDKSIESWSLLCWMHCNDDWQLPSPVRSVASDCSGRFSDSIIPTTKVCASTGSPPDKSSAVVVVAPQVHQFVIVASVQTPKPCLPSCDCLGNPRLAMKQICQSGFPD